MLRFWLVLAVICGWVACQPVGPNLPWLALYNGGQLGGTIDPSSLGTAATLCATIRAVQLTTPAAQPLVYIGSFTNDEGFGFGLDENFNIAVWQGRAGVTASTVKVELDVTNFVCVAYVFNSGSTQARVFAYQPSFQNELLTIESTKVAPTGRISVGGWQGSTYTGFINNVQVYREAFTATQPFKFSFDYKYNSDYNLLVAYPFREGAGSIVSAYEGNNFLTLSGDHAWHKRYLSSLALSGVDSLIELPVPSIPSGDLTIAMWIKVGTTLETDKKDVFVLNFVNIFYDPVANVFGATSNGDTQSFINYSVPKDTWIFVAFQIESTAGYIKLFVNKEEKHALTIAANTTATTMTIGGGNYGSLKAWVTSIQIWNSINVGVWGMGFTRITLLNAYEDLFAHYNLADTTGTTIHNWHYPPAQGELVGDISWEPVPENALNLSPTDLVAFASAPVFSASTYSEFTFSMNIYWRGSVLADLSVIVNIGDFPDTGFGLMVDTSGTLTLSVGALSGDLPVVYGIPNAILPVNKTVPVIVVVDFSNDRVTATIDSTSYLFAGVSATYADVAARVNLGIPNGGAWSSYTGFDGYISDFQMWRSVRNDAFFVGDLQKNAFVTALSPYVYAPLTDNNGGVLEIMSGALATTTGLNFATFPDRVSQFTFQFPIFAPDGTLIPQASPSSSGPSDPSAPTGGNVIQPPMEGVPIEVIVPAIVVPVVVVAVGLIVLLVLLKRRKNKKEPKEEKKAVTIENPVSDVEAARNAFAETRSTSYSNIPLQRVVASNNETSRNVDKLLNLAMRDRLNIPHEKIKFIEEIGSGSFGKVYKGDWQHCEVAVKVANVISNMDSFIQEAELMMAIRPHPNVVQLLGVSVDGGSPEMVLEFCPSGSLDTLLQSQVPLNDDQKIKLSLGIARGMLHLHLNNIIHRDLAARNILLSKDGQPKISDFGMSRVLGSDVTHTGQTRSYVGPIKWMAPEALREAIYGRKTDVWSYGITVWEIVTRKEPFDSVDLIQAALLIRDQGVTPEIPDNCPPVLRELMLMCWHQDPDQRPEFEDVCKFLQKEVK